MRNLFILFLLLASCSNDDDVCNCEKETYYYEQGWEYNGAGLPVLSSERTVLSTEVVPCQEEQEQQSNGDGTYFVIQCE